MLGSYKRKQKDRESALHGECAWHAAQFFFCLMKQGFLRLFVVCVNLGLVGTTLHRRYYGSKLTKKDRVILSIGVLSDGTNNMREGLTSMIYAAENALAVPRVTASRVGAGQSPFM